MLTRTLASVAHHNDPKAWKELLMLPQCILCAPPRGGRKHKRAVAAFTLDRLHHWQDGERASLWDTRPPPPASRKQPLPAESSLQWRTNMVSPSPWLGKGSMARLAQLCSSQGWHLPARTPTPKAGQEEHFARACDFNCFPGSTKVAAIAAPPELMRLATGDRTVRLIHCVEDKLCVCVETACYP